MNKRLEEFMYTAHRGEGIGALEAGFRGTPPSPRICDQPDIVIGNDNELDIYNLGVAAGITGLLEALADEGYVVLGPDGKPVGLETSRGKTYSHSETFSRWLEGDTRVKLKVVKA